MSADDSRGRGSFRNWVRTNQGVGAVLTSCLGAYLVYLQLSSWVHEKLRDGFTLGFFPVLGVVCMLVCTVVLIFDAKRKERIRELENMRWRWFFYCLGVLAACGAYFYLALEISFLLATPPFLLVFNYTLGLRPWTSCAAASVVTTLVIYGVFLLIGIELPSGILPF